MRTPLLSIIFFLNQVITMLNNFDRGKISKALQLCDIMNSQLEFLQGFVEDLLDLGQIKTGLFTLVRQPFELVSIIKVITQIFRPLMKSKNLTFCVEVQNCSFFQRGVTEYLTDSFPQLVGDGRRIKQILINLVKNSLKFTKIGGICLKINYNSSARELEIMVKDTGVGIDAIELESIFSCFGKLNRTAGINSAGLGLGLKIVK